MFKFTIRELLLLTLSVALTLGWIVDRRWLVFDYASLLRQEINDREVAE